MKLPKKINAALVTTPLVLSTQELNALQRVIDLAWESLPSHMAPPTKDMRSVWAASRALGKIKTHLKGL